MGCDIHTYLEYTSGNEFWGNFTENGGSRNYVMFGVLAGVRVSEVRLFEPKGMPDGPWGWRTQDGYWLRVPSEKHPSLADHDGWTSLENAEKWVERGYSKADRNDEGRIVRVSQPDWHSHSWLTADEIEQALDHYTEVIGQYNPGVTGAPPEWLATLAAMRAFEKAGAKTRLVFWFDN